MATTYLGPRRIGRVTQDDDGHRTYEVTYLVEGDLTDGPYEALRTAGLPVSGQTYALLSEADPYAFCTPYADVEVHDQKDGERPRAFLITRRFTTKPVKRCGDLRFEDPLTEPPRVSGGSTAQQVEATADRWGRPILSSSHEPLRGDLLKFEEHRDTIQVVMNVPSFTSVALALAMRDHVNLLPLWGLPTRSVRLAQAPWTQEYYGLCYSYYKLTLNFEVALYTDPATGLVSSGWDRVVLDEGTMVLNGEWDATTGEWSLIDIDGGPPDPGNPQHFVRATDRKGKPLKSVILNGAGLPADVVTGTNAYFISLANGNVGRSLADPRYWVPLQNPSLTPVPWYIEDRYQAGTVVIDEFGDVYVNEFNVTVSNDTGISDTTVWLPLDNGANLQGNYSAATAYAVGDIVSSTQRTAPGRVLVQKYHGANFLLLGIPAVFP